MDVGAGEQIFGDYSKSFGPVACKEALTRLVVDMRAWTMVDIKPCEVAQTFCETSEARLSVRVRPCGAGPGSSATLRRHDRDVRIGRG